MKKHSYASCFAFFLFSSLILLACSQQPHDEDEQAGLGFYYDEGSERGPSRWGSLEPNWRNCTDGHQQSPIDIASTQLRPQSRGIRWNYRSAPAVLKNSIKDIEVYWEGNAGSITITGTVYNVINCHWHSPSEHTVNGTRFDLELHVVHRTPQNDIAVLSILYRVGRWPDPFLSRLFPFLETLGNGTRRLGRLSPAEAIGSIEKKYYRYMGSLTTPPCSEGVVWSVYTEVKSVTRDQVVEALRNPLPLEYKNNSRPTQPLNGRPVFLYNEHGHGYGYRKIYVDEYTYTRRGRGSEALMNLMPLYDCP